LQSLAKEVPVFKSIPWFGGNPWLFLALWLVLFAVLAIIFAKGQGRSFLAGVLRILGALFYAPFMYLRNATRAVCRYTQEANDEHAHNGQYLSNKLMLILQVAVIILALAMLAGTVSTAWVSLLPPSELRRAVSSTSRSVKEVRVKVEELDTKVAALDSVWVHRRDAALHEFRRARELQIARADSSNAVLGASILNDSRVDSYWESLRDQLTSAAGEGSAQYYRYYAERYENWLAYRDYDDMLRAQLQQYVDNWLTSVTARDQLRQTTEYDIRKKEQPTWEETKNELDSSRRTLARYESELKDLKRAARLRPDRFLVSLVVGIGWFLIVVWGLGLILELLWRQIRIASDVSQLARRVSGGHDGSANG
jgi:hypothetical protein